MECLLCGDGIDYKRTTCADCLASNVVERREKLRRRKEECQPLRDLIKAHVEKIKPILRDNIANDLRESRVKLLQERIAFKKQRIAEDLEKVVQLRAKLKARRDALQEARAQLLIRQAKVSLLSTPQRIVVLKRTCEERAAELAQQRRSLIAELLSFFPVNPSPTSEKDSLIINIILPNNGIYSSYPADTLSAALGYVAHVVWLVSAYLGVVLPYPIDFAGSRSAIRTNDEPSRRFPLYGTRVNDMETGIRLLNKDIVYLGYTQGLCIPRNMYNHTLPNLMALLRSPSLGWPGPHEWSSPRLSRQLPPLRVLPRKSNTIYGDEEIDNTDTVAQQQQKNKDVDEEEDDFIVLENTVIPTPSQAEDLAHFERALFIDTS